jgi:hypothetical protein
MGIISLLWFVNPEALHIPHDVLGTLGRTIRKTANRFPKIGGKTQGSNMDHPGQHSI